MGSRVSRAVFPGNQQKIIDLVLAPVCIEARYGSISAEAGSAHRLRILSLATKHVSFELVRHIDELTYLIKND